MAGRPAAKCICRVGNLETIIVRSGSFLIPELTMVGQVDMLLLLIQEEQILA